MQSKPRSQSKRLTKEGFFLRWIAAWLAGFLTGGISVWLGVAAVPLVVGLLIMLSLANARRSVLPGGLVGLGSGIIAIVLDGATSCPAFLGLPSPSCSAPDLRPLVLFAVIIAALGLILTYRSTRPS